MNNFICFPIDVVLYRFGQSIGGSLVVANLAWPNEWAILIGSFMATTGAGLQSLISAPRLLYAISKDNLVPIFNPFSVLSPSGEPTRALMLTLGKFIGLDEDTRLLFDYCIDCC